MKCAVNNCRCHNFRTKNDPNKSRFYTFPKDEVLRQKWIAYCRRETDFNTKTERICCAHFNPEDFERNMKYEMGFMSRNILKLKPGTVPTVRHEFDSDRTEAEPTLADKIESKELINEQLFDEETMDAQSITEVKTDDYEEEIIQDVVAIEEEYKIFDSQPPPPLYSTKSVQTDSGKTCGLIEKTRNWIYNINCFHCDEKFRLSNWAGFIKHVSDQHNEIEEQFKSSNDPYQDDIYVEELLESDNYDDNGDGVLSESENAEMTLLEIETVKMETIVDQENIVEPEKTNLKELPTISEIVAQSETTIMDEHETKREEQSEPKELKPNGDHLNSDNEEGDSSQISFQRTHRAVVMHFLDLLKPYSSIFGHGKQLPLAYGNIVAEITAEFNEKWDRSMTVPAMQKSIFRVREWYRRICYCKLEDVNYKCKFSEYFDKCAEFLPKPEGRLAKLPYKCGQCDARFAYSRNAQYHEKRHSKEEKKKFKCAVCDKVFTSECKLKDHVGVHNESERTSCPVCAKVFLTPHHYRLHKIRHEPPKYVCEICSRPYFLQNKLRSHMAIHGTQRNFMCDQCGKTFYLRDNLRKHKYTAHVKGMIYPCKICGETFKYYSGLCAHKNAKHLVLEGTIEELERRAKRKRIRKHEYVLDPKTNEERVVCNICGKTYRSMGSMNSHKFRQHRNVRSNDTKLEGTSEYAVDDGDADGDDNVVEDGDVDDDGVFDVIEEITVIERLDDDDYKEDFIIEEFIINE